MLPKKVPFKYNAEHCFIIYTRDVIDRNEIQFNIVDVKTESGENLWNRQLTIHYYPVGINKIESPFFSNESLEKLKSAIVAKILENEQI